MTLNALFKEIFGKIVFRSIEGAPKEELDELHDEAKEKLAQILSVQIDSSKLDLSKLEPGIGEIEHVPSSSFVLSEVEEAK